MKKLLTTTALVVALLAPGVAYATEPLRPIDLGIAKDQSLDPTMAHADEPLSLLAPSYEKDAATYNARQIATGAARYATDCPGDRTKEFVAARDGTVYLPDGVDMPDAETIDDENFAIDATIATSRGAYCRWLTNVILQREIKDNGTLPSKDFALYQQITALGVAVPIADDAGLENARQAK